MPSDWFQLFAPLMSTAAAIGVGVTLERLRSTRERVDKLEDRERKSYADSIRADERLQRISDTGKEIAELEKRIETTFDKVSVNVGKLREEISQHKETVTAKLSQVQGAVRALDLTKRSKESDARFPAQGAESSGRFPAPRPPPALEDTEPPPPKR